MAAPNMGKYSHMITHVTKHQDHLIDLALFFVQGLALFFVQGCLGSDDVVYFSFL